MCVAEGKVLGDAGDNRHAMHQRGCGDQGIARVAAVGHIQAATISDVNGTLLGGFFGIACVRVEVTAGKGGDGLGGVLPKNGCSSITP